MSRLKLLDLFCGAGIGTRGYAALFDITGVDLLPQPYYPFAFEQGDAFEYLAKHGHEFDLIHASPNCEGYSRASQTAGKYRKHYDREIEAVRALLIEVGKPYVIENVEGAKAELRNPVLLCGSMFPGVVTYRHRLFETSPEILLRLPHEPHADETPAAGKGRSPKGYISICAGGIRGVSQAERFAAMGLPGIVATNRALVKGFPPQYCAWIGEQMHAILTA